MINLSCLGNYGRFGNQLFQYAFAKAYANHLNVPLHTPSWIGQEIFSGINDPPINQTLPNTPEDNVPLPPKSGIDLVGYFQGPMHLEMYNENFAKSIFQIKPELVKILEKGLPKKKYLAAHLRRGDYVDKYAHVFAIVEKGSYIKKAKELDFDENEIVWISEESSFKNPELPEHLSFLQDFYILMKADILLRANSSFSWWAGTLSDNQCIYSPQVLDKVGWQEVNFVRGNHSAIIWQPPYHMDLRLGV